MVAERERRSAGRSEEAEGQEGKQQGNHRMKINLIYIYKWRLERPCYGRHRL